MAGPVELHRQRGGRRGKAGTPKMGRWGEERVGMAASRTIVPGRGSSTVGGGGGGRGHGAAVGEGQILGEHEY